MQGYLKIVHHSYREENFSVTEGYAEKVHYSERAGKSL